MGPSWGCGCMDGFPGAINDTFLKNGLFGVKRADINPRGGRIKLAKQRHDLVSPAVGDKGSGVQLEVQDNYGRC